MISREKQNIIPFLAIMVLIIGMVSTVYVHTNQAQQSIDAQSILINDQPFKTQELFTTFSTMTIQTDDGNKTGISLSEVILSHPLDCPNCHTYLIKASDGYQQTVDWHDMQQGILSLEKRVYFPHLAHAFWVRDVIEIEVNS
jgi:hypothetical protein